MKIIMVALYGVGAIAATAAGVWLSMDPQMDAASTAAQQAGAPVNAEQAVSANQASSLWTWGNSGAPQAQTRRPAQSLDVLLTQALRPNHTPVNDEDPRATLRKLAEEDPAVVKQLIQAYDKQNNSQVRQLIVSLLTGIDKPEVLTFTRQLVQSKDMTQRREGFAMLQYLNADAPGVRPLILHTLSTEKTPEAIMLALAALKPPADSNGTGAPTGDATAVVAQLQALTRNADPNIRQQSILQLAEWDKSDSSQQQWVQALADQSPQVRQAAVTAVAQSSTQAPSVKAALLYMASNQSENKDVRGNALQALERFALSEGETADLGRLRAQISGS